MPSALPPVTGRWSDGTRAQLDVIKPPATMPASECCAKLFRTADVTRGTVHYLWRLEVCDTIISPLCASKVDGGESLSLATMADSLLVDDSMTTFVVPNRF